MELKDPTDKRLEENKGEENLMSENALQLALCDVQTAIKQCSCELDLTLRDLPVFPEEILKMSNLTHLYLARNLMEALPDQFGACLPNLEVLNLHDNLLQSLPESIGQLGRLKHLDISKNNLVYLPESIMHCSSLEHLNANFNMLETLPKGFGTGLQNLKKLTLALNKIDRLPGTIVRLSSLTHLDVHFNRIGYIPESFGHVKTLEYLDLSDNFADLQTLPSSMGNLTNLKYLNLSNNQIHRLPLEMGRLKKLEKIVLIGNPLVVPPLSLATTCDTVWIKEYLAEEYEKHLNGILRGNGRESGGASTGFKWLDSILKDLNLFGWVNNMITPISCKPLQCLPSNSCSMEMMRREEDEEFEMNEMFLGGEYGQLDKIRDSSKGYEVVHKDDVAYITCVGKV